MDNLKSVHWAIEYIGKPWSLGSHGPAAFDCYGLLWSVYLKKLNIKLPLYQGVNVAEEYAASREIRQALEPLGEEKSDWLRVDKPFEFCAVGMGNGNLSHVGIYTEIEGGLIVHAGEKMRVVAWPLRRLRSMYRRIEFYKHGLHH